MIVRRRWAGASGRLDGHGTARHTAAIVPTAGWLLVIELSNLAMYASGRIILGAYRTPRAVGLYEGPVRAHNLLYALAGALAVPTVPTASRYVATGDERRLRELAVRGSRYTLALFVPLCVTLMVLAEPILGRLARRPLHGRRHRAVHPRVVLAALRRADRHAGLPRGRGRGAHGRPHALPARPRSTWRWR